MFDLMPTSQHDFKRSKLCDLSQIVSHLCTSCPKTLKIRLCRIDSECLAGEVCQCQWFQVQVVGPFQVASRSCTTTSNYCSGTGTLVLVGACQCHCQCLRTSNCLISIVKAGYLAPTHILPHWQAFKFDLLLVVSQAVCNRRGFTAQPLSSTSTTSTTSTTTTSICLYG